MPFGGFVLVGLFGLLVIDREPLPSGQVEALKLAFLTEEQVEIGGEMKPAYVTYSATASMAENSTIMLSYGTESIFDLVDQFKVMFCTWFYFLNNGEFHVYLYDKFL